MLWETADRRPAPITLPPTFFALPSYYHEAAPLTSAGPAESGTILRHATVTAAVPDRRLAVRGFACLVLGAVAMGASPIFVRLTDIGPQASAFWRTALALPFLWIWARLENRPTGAPRLSGAVWLAGLFFAGDLFFWHLSILATTVANATFLATTAPIWVALGAGLVLSEKVGARTLAGLLLGEPLGLAQLCGGVLILLGIWIARPRGAAIGP